MKQKKYTKRALCMSLLSMLLCCSMLIGTTFAWFTDSVTSGRNQIVAGNLDVELYHGTGTDETDKVGTDTKLFLDVDGKEIKWEPGVIAYENFTVKNVGTLALKYKLAMNVYGNNTVTVGSEKKSLADVIKVAILKGEYFTGGDRAAAEALTFDSEITDFVENNERLEPGAEEKFAVVLYWEPSDNDDDYNLKNGKESSDGEPLWIELGVELQATQAVYESDSFDKTYDSDAKLPELINATVSGKAGGVYGTEPVRYRHVGEWGAEATSVDIPQVNAESDSVFTLTVETTGATENSYHLEISLKKDGAPVSEAAAKNYRVNFNIGAGKSDVKVSHSDTAMENDGSWDKEGYVYNAATGALSLYVSHFSPFEVTWTTATPEKWDGTTVDTNWYDGSGYGKAFVITTPAQLAGLAKLVDEGTDTFINETIVLAENAVFDLGGHDWNPIGDKNHPFKGKLDGNGAIIQNANVAAQDSTGTTTIPHGRSGFISDLRGTVENVTFRNFNVIGNPDADANLGYTEIGIVAGYSNLGTFSNITVENCTISAYGNYVGGLVGNGDAKISDCTVRNCYIKSTGKYVAAIAGEWDMRSLLEGQKESNWIENCTVENCVIEGKKDVAGIIGWMRGGINHGGLRNLTVRETTFIGSDPDGRIGGIIGTSNGGKAVYENWTVENCTMQEKSVTVNCGGMIGGFQTGSSNAENLLGFKNCQVSGMTVIAEGEVRGFGGFVGGQFNELTECTNTTISFENCTADITVQSSEGQTVSGVGGFLGKGANYRVTFTGTNTYRGAENAIGAEAGTVTGTATKLS